MSNKTKDKELIKFGSNYLTKNKALSELIGMLTYLSNQAFSGEIRAEKTLQRIYGIISAFNSPNVELPVKRAIEFMDHRRLVSYYVKRAPKNTCCVFHGTVVMNEEAEGIYLYEKIKKLWKPRSTLTSLAMRYYLGILRDQGFETIDERVILRDLKALNRWKAQHDPDPHGESVLINPFGVPHLGNVEAWKHRHRKKR